jgi:hypothetical protein
MSGGAAVMSGGGAVMYILGWHNNSTIGQTVYTATTQYYIMFPRQYNFITTKTF